jgi:PEP-CTERM motif-containing protein
MYTKIQTIVGATLASVTLMASSATAAVTIDVRPSSAPNFFGSPSWTAYQANAMNALQNGLSAIGDRATDPTAYLAFTDGATIDAGNAMVTSFPSWIGVADPAAPFASELGNRLHFGLHAVGDGTTQFTLADVNFNLTSSEPGNALGFAGSLVGTTFNGTSRIGVDWGADRAPGGGDDTLLNSNEADNVLMDELFYVGVGNAFWPGGDDTDKVNPDAGRQGAIDETYLFAAQNSPLVISTTYTIFADNGSASVVIPEPASMALLGLGGLAMFKRNTKRHA